MPNKSLDYFMRPQKEEIVTIPGIPSFKDSEGNIIDFEVRVLSQAEINKIRENYRERTVARDKKGQPYITGGEVIWQTRNDSARATRHMIVEALVYPNLKDKKLMEYYNCVDITDMPLLVFSHADEYSYIVKAVLEVLGIIDSETEEKDDLESAKN